MSEFEMGSEMMSAMNELSRASSAVSHRFQTRLDQSNAMKLDKSDWKREIEEYHNTLMRNERNNGREDMANAIREVWSAKLYRNDLTADDLIQSAKIYLQNKDK